MQLENLKISDSVLRILKENKLDTIKILCNRTKTDLKILGLTNKEIKQLNIQLQQQGFKLKYSL